MRTRVKDLLGIEFPILAFSHCRDVVAAVSRVGGFGVLGAVAHTPDQLDHDLDLDPGGVGGAPFGVDLLLPQKYVGADEGGLDAAGGGRLASRPSTRRSSTGCSTTSACPRCPTTSTSPGGP